VTTTVSITETQSQWESQVQVSPVVRAPEISVSGTVTGLTLLIGLLLVLRGRIKRPTQILPPPDNAATRAHYDHKAGQL
jgi:hypothetical protein